MIRVLLGLCPDCAEGLANEAAGYRDLEGLCEGCWARLLDAASTGVLARRDTSIERHNAAHRCYPSQNVHRPGCSHLSANSRSGGMG